MPTTRTVFYGFGAYVGSITGQTTCGWWPDDPTGQNWNPATQIPVDLSKCPANFVAGVFKNATDIQTDDHRGSGGYNVIGPQFPGGSMVGLCWLSKQYWSSLPNPPPRQPVSAPNDAWDYELTQLYYHATGKRFQGYHGKIIGTNGALSRVSIWFAGTSRVANPLGSWWINLAQDAHPVDPEATRIAQGGLQEGAVFLDRAYSATLFADGGPKRPPLGGMY
jgi:hypothetical protein